MYGIIQNSLKNLVVSLQGEKAWHEIARQVEMPTEFSDDQSYSDEDTFMLIAAVCEKMKIDADECLETFGLHWVAETGSGYHSNLMNITGSDFLEFMKNVNLLHDRLSTAYPGYIAPSFEVKEVGENIEIRYKSIRKGMTAFVKGILKGLAKRFCTDIKFIKQVNESTADLECTLFIVSIN
jgi:hypothetical protein